MTIRIRIITLSAFVIALGTFSAVRAAGANTLNGCEGGMCAACCDGGVETCECDLGCPSGTCNVYENDLCCTSGWAVECTRIE